MSADVIAGIAARSALVVVAHPDDESFGLGAVLASLTGRQVAVRAVCLTHGEASTLGAVDDLGTVRARELEQAARALGMPEVTLLDYADGTLAGLPPGDLDTVVAEHLRDTDLLVVFEPGGVTGHPDHRAATAAAERVARRRSLPVLEWGVAPDVARTLNRELGTAFVGLDGVDVEVDRSAQWRAIRCHRTQAHDNPVLRRRLELQGDRERVRLVPAGE